MQRGSMRQKRLCRFRMRRRFERRPLSGNWGRTGIASVCALCGGKGEGRGSGGEQMAISQYAISCLVFLCPI